ncbi:hypothetical protein FXO38_30207 [Capsicum annuum]|nr:hypothetical protein FXO38_30207 [Capsicum annuum]
MCRIPCQPKLCPVILTSKDQEDTGSAKNILYMAGQQKGKDIPPSPMDQIHYRPRRRTGNQEPKATQQKLTRLNGCGGSTMTLKRSGGMSFTLNMELTLCGVLEM